MHRHAFLPFTARGEIDIPVAAFDDAGSYAERNAHEVRFLMFHPRGELLREGRSEHGVCHTRLQAPASSQRNCYVGTEGKGRQMLLVEVIA